MIVIKFFLLSACGELRSQISSQALPPFPKLVESSLSMFFVYFILNLSFFRAIVCHLIKPVLNRANFCFANLVRGIRRTATKLCLGSKKFSLSMFWEYSPSSANLASDWLRAKRSLLWMRNK